MLRPKQRFASALVKVEKREVETRVRQEIKAIFKQGARGVRRIYFPLERIEAVVQDEVRLVVVAPDQARRLLRRGSLEHRRNGRTRPQTKMNPAVIECVPAATRRIYAAGRRAVAWEGILERLASSKTSDIARLVQIKAAEARGGLREAIWQSYNQVRVYGEDAAQRVYDLGEIHCSSAATLTGLVVDHLEKQSHSFFPMEND